MGQESRDGRVEELNEAKVEIDEVVVVVVRWRYFA